MSQNSVILPTTGTVSGLTMTQNINNAFNTLLTLNSGASEPSVMSAYMLWADTTTGLLKIRNADNLAWVTIGELGTTNLGIAGGISKWIDLTATTDFSTTAASTSTITMNTDQTANILVGYAIKFTLSGVVYYAQCPAIASNLLTIRGAPLTTGAGALTALSYSPLPSQVMELYLPVDGYYEDATETALLLNDMRYQYKWNLSKAYVVAISHMQRTVDTGTEANVNVLANSAAVCTANTNQGRAMSSTADTWVATDIDISTSNYDINYGETIEIQATKAGNGDARDLTVSVVLVFP